MIRVMARWGIGPYMERGTNLTKSERQGIREARGGKEGKREFDRCERQRAEDAAAPSSCPRRTNLDRFPNVRPGSGSADPGIFGYFPSMESTSPGGETFPVLLRKSGPRDGQKANFKRRAGSSRPTAGRHMGRPLRDMMNGCLYCRGGCPHPPGVLWSAPSSVSLRSTASPLRGEACKTHPTSLPHPGGKVASP